MTANLFATSSPYKSTQRGVTYLALLILVAGLLMLVASTGEVWVISRQRASERELLFVGNEFRQAIRSYYLQTPGTLKRYPQALEDMLKDRRNLQIVRHLRRIYRDPFTSRQTWGLVVAPDGGIMGVYSMASGRPLKQTKFDDANQGFEDASSYAAWQFIYMPQ